VTTCGNCEQAYPRASCPRTQFAGADNQLRLFSVPPPSRSKTTPPGKRESIRSVERVTVVPTFDLEAFARESETRQVAAAPSTVESREGQERECLEAIGSESTVLLRAVSDDRLKHLAIGPVGAFLFSLLDGNTDVETVIDIAGLQRLEVLRHLRDLVERGIVVIAPIGRFPRR
jgi:hypothetical protein